MAGPCSIENRDQMFTTAARVKAAGGSFLRGGAFKPRSSPYAFQGLGIDGLKIMREAADAHGLLVVSEVMEISQIEPMLPYVDLLPGGRAQHAELQPAARTRLGAQAGAAEARHRRHHRRTAALGRIHSQPAATTT